jgi:hypothetical protein
MGCIIGRFYLDDGDGDDYKKGLCSFVLVQL